MLWKQCRLPGIHGAVRSEDSEEVHGRANALLRAVLMESGRLQISSEEDEATQILTTGGKAAGPLIGGNSEMIATAAGWALPDLTGAILLLEGINMRLGQLDRLLTMLRKAGHLNGVAGVAIGQFSDCASGTIGVLRDQLGRSASRCSAVSRLAMAERRSSSRSDWRRGSTRIAVYWRWIIELRRLSSRRQLACNEPMLHR
jgi:muramoyltetrapeptide carboxypeptidase